MIEENILIFDEYVSKKIINEKYINQNYPQYFAPEIKTFLNEEWFPNKNAWVENIKKELPTNFHELRKVGED